MYKPKKTTYAKVAYADIAGLGSGEEGQRSTALSGELMNAIGANDALLHVVRVFADDNVPHPLGSINPAPDIETLDTELSLSDLSKIENRLERLAGNLKKGRALPTFEDDQKEFEILSRLKPHVEQGQPLRDVKLTADEEKRLRGYQFLKQMRDARRAYNNAKTPEEVATLLADPANRDFKTFIEWQNKPSWDQLQFLKEHPEILPYAVSGFEGRRTNERDIGFLWSKMADFGVADPAGYIDRIDEKVAMINRVIEALDARKARDDEMKWWNSYRKKHEDDHNIARLTFEWQNSEGAFAPGGIFYQQGRVGYAARNRDLNGPFSGLTDPFTRLTPRDDFDNHSAGLHSYGFGSSAVVNWFAAVALLEVAFLAVGWWSSRKPTGGGLQVRA